MQNKTFVKEIFESVQGEGPYVGYNQLFVRFSKCNLNCQYCDTDFTSELNEYTPSELANIVNKHDTVHSVSLTGGEPLVEIDFLMEFLPLVRSDIYLETNGTLCDELEKVINWVDYVSMDVKLPSTSKNQDLFSLHKKFIGIVLNAKKEIYLKVVFDENITEQEITKTVDLANRNHLLIVLQPKMDGDKLNLKSDLIHDVFCKFAQRYNNVRLIPQVHKFLNLL